MSKIVIFGATGYTGANIAREAAARGHQVVGVVRNPEGKAIEGVGLIAGDISDTESYAQIFAGADTVVVAVHHGNPRVVDLVHALMAAAKTAGARLAVVGGAGSLLVAEGGPHLIETPEFPDAYKHEAGLAWDTLTKMQQLDDCDWFFVSPAAGYGSFAPGERTGSYRLGGDVLVSDAEGKSFIGGEDYAIAFVDEIEQKKHSNQRFTVGY